MKIRAYLKYFVNDRLWKQFLASNLSQIPSNLICLTNFVILVSLRQFKPKIRATNLQKALKLVLLDNYFLDLFTEVQIWY